MATLEVVPDLNELEHRHARFALSREVPAPFLNRLAAIAKPLGENQELNKRPVAQGYGWVGSTPEARGEELSKAIAIYKRLVAATPVGELTR